MEYGGWSMVDGEWSMVDGWSNRITNYRYITYTAFVCKYIIIFLFLIGTDRVL